MSVMSFLKALGRYRSTLVFLLTPIVLLALPLAVPGKEGLCGYCMALMGVYWMTEVIPIPITSFIPLVLFPLLGIMTAADVSKAYINDTSWLYVGGLIIAVSVEITNLHKRISLAVLTVVGTKPRCLMFGFMITAFFLSMWVSNTATTAMMLPIVEAVTNELISERRKDNQKDKKEKTHEMLDIVNQSGLSNKVLVDDADATSDSMQFAEHDVVDIVEGKQKNKRKLKDEMTKKDVYLQKGLTICVPYASSIGGTATLTGTGTNLVLSGQYAKIFPDANIQLSFATWLAYCLPSALIFFFIAYLWISSFYLGFNIRDMLGCFKRGSLSDAERRANELLKREYRKLGPISWAEGTVLVVFVTTALLWFFRNPGFMPGWSVLFEGGFVRDGTVAIAMASLLFFLPSRKPAFLNTSKASLSSPVPPVLKWAEVQRIFSWGVVILMGGGFALAQGATESGLSQWLGDQLNVLRGMDTWVISLIITIIACAFTEFTSNVATATLFVPIVASLAQTLEVHPLYLLVPSILATSMAFMLPVATPPNAVAFAYGHLKVLDLVKVGSLLNIIGVGVVTLFINTYGYSFFGLGTFPDWARAPNTTSSDI